MEIYATDCVYLRVASNLIEPPKSMKKTSILLLFILPVITFSQTHIFELKSKTHFSERNKFLKDSIWRFNQIIEYNDPGLIDEESWIRLTIEVRDTMAFMNLKGFDFNKDSLIIDYHFADFTVWFASYDSSSISGKVEFVSQQSKGIILKLDLIVTNRKNHRTYIYNGERTFSRAVNILDFYY